MVAPEWSNCHPWMAAAMGTSTHQWDFLCPLSCIYPRLLIGINPGSLILNAPSTNGSFSSLLQPHQQEGKITLYFDGQLGTELQRPWDHSESPWDDQVGGAVRCVFSADNPDNIGLKSLYCCFGLHSPRKKMISNCSWNSATWPVPLLPSLCTG